MDMRYLIQIRTRNGIAYTFSPLYGDEFLNRVLRLFPPQILTNYGQPAQVLVGTFLQESDRSDVKWSPFSLVLLYPERRIFVEYVSQGETRDNFFVGCPSISDIHLAVWSIQSNYSLEDVVKMGGGSEIQMLAIKPLEEVTSMTIAEFYQKFKDPENTECLKTPVHLWSKL